MALLGGFLSLFNLLNQVQFHVCGNAAIARNAGPKLYRWRGNELVAQCNHAEIVIEMWVLPAMLSAASHSWMALTIGANSSNVISQCVGQENVGT